MIKITELKMISMEDLSNLEMLKTHCIYSDEFVELPKTRQLEIYRYCKLRATNEYIRENLKQIRYAVTDIYFENIYKEIIYKEIKNG